MSCTYRRVSEADEEWYYKRTGAETLAQQCSESSPPNYSHDVDVRGYFSIDTTDDIFDGRQDHYDNFEKSSKTVDANENEKFLDRMESTLFSYANRHCEDNSSLDTFVFEDDEEEYDGEPKDENYFGEEARSKFFALYHHLAKRGLHDGPVIHIPTATKNFTERMKGFSAKKTGATKRVSYIWVPEEPSSEKHALNDMEDIEELAELEDSNDNDDIEDDDDSNPAIDVNNIEVEEQDRPKSPRHRFLIKLISDGKVPPLPIIIRHSNVSEELNLAHRALGDDYIIYLSDVVSDLPCLTKLNLRDNRLTDRGMGVFIHALAHQQRITDVDISENKIDSASAEALTHYLKDPHCTLMKLRMANADLDDDEIAIFMNALEVNRSIIEMDVSHNLLGGRGEKQTRNMNLDAEHVVGGASVAAALKINETLLTLDLSWNKLGLASSIHLGNALTLNGSLTAINLAYNTIRDEGAEIIGSSLASNTALRVLNLSSNGIGPMGMVVISTGLRLCEGLERLDISGNPIGRQGVASLLQTLNYHSVERSFNLSDCVFDDSGTKTPIDLEFPSGKHSFDLSKPSSRCLVLELYSLASLKRGVKFASIDYRPIGKNAKKVSVKLTRLVNPCNNMGVPYSPYRGSGIRPQHPYTLLGASEWMEIANKLYMVDESTGKKWEIPFTGVLVVECVYTPQLPTPIDCLNSTGMHRLISLIKHHPKQYLQILSQCQNIAMETYQLDKMLTSLDEFGMLKQRTDMIAHLLPCCCDTSNVSRLLDKYVPKIENLKDIQLMMRQLFFVCTNSFTGHYVLDLENINDRRTAIRLMAISAYEVAYVKNKMPSWSNSHCFLSQNGSQANFRNETYCNIPVEGGLTASFFAGGLKDNGQGILEFDFVSITRPQEGCQAESNGSLERSLDAHGLLHPHQAVSSMVLRTRRRALHGNIDITSSANSPRCRSPVLSEENSIIASGVSEPADLEQVLGPHVQSELNRISTREPLPCSVVDFLRFAENSPHICLHDMMMEDLTQLNNQLNLDNAMFFDGKQMEKYTITAVIRIQSASCNKILEPLAHLNRLAENGSFGFMGQGKNEDAKLSLNDLLTVDAYFNTVKFDPGMFTIPNVHSAKPSHKKFTLEDDVVVMGSEMFVEVKCPHWSMDKIVARAKEVVASLFKCLEISDTHVKLMSHKVTEMKTSPFASGVCTFSNCINRIVAHQIDFTIDGLPPVDEILVKTTSKAKVNYNNIVWRWRDKTAGDRGPFKMDLNLYTHEYWGSKVMHLRSLVGRLWINCIQATFIASRFPQFGNDGHPLRESVIVLLFSRIVDIENFRLVVESVPTNNCYNIYRRVGWLNAINPHEVDFLFNLDLSIGDERLMAAIIAKFAAVEPGDNVLEPRYRRTFEDIFSCGWDLPASWCVDPEKAKYNDGVPRRGQFIGEYCSSPLKGCKKVPWVREEYHDRYFLMAVPSAPWNEDIYEYATAEKKWEL